MTTTTTTVVLLYKKMPETRTLIHYCEGSGICPICTSGWSSKAYERKIRTSSRGYTPKLAKIKNLDQLHILKYGKGFGSPRKEVSSPRHEIPVEPEIESNEEIVEEQVEEDTFYILPRSNILKIIPNYDSYFLRFETPGTFNHTVSMN